MFGGWPTEMPYNTNGAAISNAMLETKYFKRATSRLDFVKIRSKRVNRPTSEAQPQKKTWQPQTETRFTRGRLKKRANTTQAYTPQIDPYKMVLRPSALIEEQIRFYSNLIRGSSPYKTVELRNMFCTMLRFSRVRSVRNREF